METTFTQPAATPAAEDTQQPLRISVEGAIKNYFTNLGDQKIQNLYELVLAEVEEPLLKAVMDFLRGNQSKAAIMLGISRGTLRKKLKIYGLL